MKRYRENLASRGVRQVQVNLPDAMLDWVDQIAAEKGLARSAIIEVLCRAGASRFEVETGPDTSSPNRLRSTLLVSGPGTGQFSRFFAPLLDAHAQTAHVLYVTAMPAEGRPLSPAGRTVCDWRASSPVVQGQRFNPLASHVLPERAESRRVYVRWLAQTLAPERGDYDAAFSDSTRQLIEETILALVAGHDSPTLDELAATIEAMPWPPPSGPVPGAPNKRVVDLLAGQHNGLAPFAERDDKALVSVVEAARDALAAFRAPEIRRLSAVDDDLLGRFQGPPSVLQIANAGLGTPASRLAVMFITALIARRLGSRPGVTHPIVIALEDIGSLPRIPGLEEALSIGHRHSLCVLATAHSLRQIEARYGEATALALRASSDLVSTQPIPARLSVVEG